MSTVPITASTSVVLINVEDYYPSDPVVLFGKDAAYGKLITVRDKAGTASSVSPIYISTTADSQFFQDISGDSFTIDQPYGSATLLYKGENESGTGVWSIVNTFAYPGATDFALFRDVTASSITLEGKFTYMYDGDQIAEFTSTTFDIAANIILNGHDISGVEQIYTSNIDTDFISAATGIIEHLDVSTLSASDRITTADLIADWISTTDLEVKNGEIKDLIASTIYAETLVETDYVSTTNLVADWISTNTAEINDLTVESTIAGYIDATSISTTYLTADEFSTIDAEIKDLVASTIYAEDLVETSYVSTTDLVADWISTNTAEINDLTVESTIAGYIDATSISTTYLTADEFSTIDAEIKDLVASTIYAEDLIETSYVSTTDLLAEWISSKTAEIKDLEASTITADFLDIDAISTTLLGASFISANTLAARIANFHSTVTSFAMISTVSTLQQVSRAIVTSTITVQSPAFFSTTVQSHSTIYARNMYASTYQLIDSSNVAYPVVAGEYRITVSSGFARLNNQDIYVIPSTISTTYLYASNVGINKNSMTAGRVLDVAGNAQAASTFFSSVQTTNMSTNAAYASTIAVNTTSATARYTADIIGSLQASSTFTSSIAASQMGAITVTASNLAISTNAFMDNARINNLTISSATVSTITAINLVATSSIGTASSFASTVFVSSVLQSRNISTLYTLTSSLSINTPTPVARYTADINGSLQASSTFTSSINVAQINALADIVSSIAINTTAAPARYNADIIGSLQASSTFTSSIRANVDVTASSFTSSIIAAQINTRLLSSVNTLTSSISVNNQNPLALFVMDVSGDAFIRTLYISTLFASTQKVTGTELGQLGINCNAPRLPYILDVNGSGHIASNFYTSSLFTSTAFVSSSLQVGSGLYTLIQANYQSNVVAVGNIGATVNVSSATFRTDAIVSNGFYTPTVNLVESAPLTNVEIYEGTASTTTKNATLTVSRPNDNTSKFYSEHVQTTSGAKVGQGFVQNSQVYGIQYGANNATTSGIYLNNAGQVLLNTRNAATNTTVAVNGTTTMSNTATPLRILGPASGTQSTFIELIRQGNGNTQTAVIGHTDPTTDNLIMQTTQSGADVQTRTANNVGVYIKDSSRNVGIGTTNPLTNYTLHVQGSMFASTISTTNIFTSSIRMVSDVSGTYQGIYLSSGRIMIDNKAIAYTNDVATNALSNIPLNLSTNVILASTISTQNVFTSTLVANGLTTLINQPRLRRWVGGGSGGSNIEWSDDGSNWNLPTTGVFSNAVNTIIYDGSKYIAGASISTLATSVDGTVWNRINVPSIGTCYGIATNGQTYIGATDGSTYIIRSIDGGNTWSNITTSLSTRFGIATNGKMWVAVGNEFLGATPGKSIGYSTDDGLSWTAVSGIFTTGDGFTDPFGKCVAWNGIMWLAGGYSTTGSMFYSYNGSNWIQVVNSTSIFTTTNSIAWNGNMWVAVGQGNHTIAYSYDGSNWTGLGKTIFGGSGYGISWNGNMWVAVGQVTNTHAYSFNGLSWSNVGNGQLSSYGYAVAYSSNITPDLQLSNFSVYSQGIPNYTASTNQLLITSSATVLNNTLFVNKANNTVGINMNPSGNYALEVLGQTRIAYNLLVGSSVNALRLSSIVQEASSITTVIERSRIINTSSITASTIQTSQVSTINISTNTIFVPLATAYSTTTSALLASHVSANYAYLSSATIGTNTNPTPFHISTSQASSVLIHYPVAAGQTLLTQQGIELGVGRNASGLARVDLIGDATYTDYGTRLERGAAGANASTILAHRGTGQLNITAVEAAPIHLNTNNTTQLTVTATGSVGIGTTTPAQKLDVIGSVYASGKYIVQKATSATAPDYTFNGETTTGLYSPATNAVALTTNGSERLRVDATGNVGINTASPSILLDVAGAARTASLSTTIISTAAINASSISTHMIYTNSSIVNFLSAQVLQASNISAQQVLASSVQANYISSQLAMISTVSTNLIYTSTLAAVFISTGRFEAGSITLNIANFNSLSVTGNETINNSWSSNILVAGGNTNTTLAYSIDNGVTWSAPVGGAGTAIGTSVNAILWDGVRFTAVGESTGTKAMTSTDGSNWTAITSILLTSMYGIAYNGSRYVVVGTGGGSITTTTDQPSGSTWANWTANTALGVGYGVAWNGSMWIAVGEKNAGQSSIVYSTNGTSWTNATDAFSTRGRRVAWNGIYWIAVGEGTNPVARSSDGITWTSVTVSGLTAGYDIAWNGILWVLVGTGTNTIYYSYDGITWTGTASTIFTITTPPPSPNTYAVTWTGRQFVATGLGSTNLYATSPDGITWTGRGIQQLTAGRSIAYSRIQSADFILPNLNIYSRNMPNYNTSTNQILLHESSMTINDTLTINKNSDFVGIRNANPTVELDVYGTGRMYALSTNTISTNTVTANNLTATSLATLSALSTNTISTNTINASNITTSGQLTATTLATLAAISTNTISTASITTSSISAFASLITPTISTTTVSTNTVNASQINATALATLAALSTNTISTNTVNANQLTTTASATLAALSTNTISTNTVNANQIITTASATLAALSTNTISTTTVNASNVTITGQLTATTNATFAALSTTSISTGTVNVGQLNGITNATLAAISTNTISTATVNTSQITAITNATLAAISTNTISSATENTGRLTATTLATLAALSTATISTASITTSTITALTLMTTPTISTTTLSTTILATSQLTATSLATLAALSTATISTGIVNANQITTTSLATLAALSTTSISTTTVNALNMTTTGLATLAAISTNTISTATISTNTLATGQLTATSLATLAALSTATISTGTVTAGQLTTTSLATLAALSTTSISTTTVNALNMTTTGLATLAAISTNTISTATIRTNTLATGQLTATGLATLAALSTATISTGTVNTGQLTTTSLATLAALSTTSISTTTVNALNMTTTGLVTTGLATLAALSTTTISTGTINVGQLTATGLATLAALSTTTISTTTVNASNVTIAGTVQAALGTALAPSYTFAGDTNNGFFSPGADILAVTTNGTERLRIWEDGTIGIGTTPKPPIPAGDVYINKGVTINSGLNVTNNINASNTINAYNGIYINQGSLASPSIYTLDMNTFLPVGLYFPSGDIAFTTSGSDRMRIGSTGNVGIGTASPSILLDINGAARMASLSTTTISTGTVNSSNITMTSIFSRGNGSATFPVYSFSTSINTGMYQAAANTLSFTTGGFERVRIDSTGILTAANATFTNFSTNIISTGTVNAGQLTAITNATLAAISTNTISTGTFNVGQLAVTTNATLAALSTTIISTTTVNASNVNVTGSFGTNAIQTGLGSATAPSHSFTADTNTGIFSPGADTLALATAGSERFRIDSAGKIGIGTTPFVGNFEVYSSSNTRLVVRDAQNASGTPSIFFGTPGGGTRDKTAIMAESLGTSLGLDYGFSRLHFCLNNNSQDIEASLANSRMTITHDGFVGIGNTRPITQLQVAGTAVVSGSIGIGITNPTTQLQVVGSANISGTAVVSGSIGIGTNNPTVLLDVNGAARMASLSTTTISTTTVNASQLTAITNATLAALSTNTISTNTINAASVNIAGSLGIPSALTNLGSASAPSYSFTGDTNTGIFSPGADTLAATTAGTERFRIDSAGNVGIGINNPRKTLDVYSSGNTSAVIRGADEFNTATLYLGTPAGTSSALKAAIIAEGISSYGRSKLHFCTENTTGNTSPTYDASIATSRMTIDSGGNVGIGSTNPLYLLDVNGPTRMASLSTTTISTTTVNASQLTAITNATLAAISTTTISTGTVIAGQLTAITNATLAAISTNTISTGTFNVGQLAVTTNATLAALSTTTISTNTINAASVNISGSLGIPSALTNLGSASAPSHSFTADTNTGIFSPGADTLALATAGSEQLRIVSTGNVGIGITNPNYKLDVAGSVELTGYQNTTAAPKLWVATGSGTNVLSYSGDGTTWSNSVNGNTVLSAASGGNAVAWNGSRWVATGNGTVSVAYSTNGSNWTSGSGNPPGIGYAVAWNGSLWLVGGTVNMITYSSDGITWTDSVNGNAIFGTGNSVRSFAWNGSRWVAGGAGTLCRLAYSSDGITWTASSSGNSVFGGTYIIYGIAWNGRLFVAVGNDGTNGIIATSPDGITWTSRITFIIPLFAVAWNGQTFIVGGGVGTMYTPQITTSTDGISWTSLSSPSGLSGAGQIRSIAWNGSLWVAVLDSTTLVGITQIRIITSTDGITWTSRTAQSSTAVYGVAYSVDLNPDLKINNLSVYTQGVPTYINASPQILTTQSTMTLYNSVYLPSTGNVGIGNANPTVLLDVNGAARMASLSTTTISTTTVNASQLTAITNATLAAISTTTISTGTVIASQLTAITNATLAAISTTTISTGTVIAGQLTAITNATLAAISTNTISTGTVVAGQLTAITNATLAALSTTTISTNTIQAALGTALAPSYTFAGDTNNGMFSPTIDNIAFTTAGTERLRIDSGGNVGIGTTNPSSRVTIQKGTLGSSTAFDGKATLSIIGDSISARTTTTPQEILYLHQPNTFNQSKGSAFGISLAFYEDPANNNPRTRVDFKTTGKTTDSVSTFTTVMSLMDSGNVGIGKTNPSDTLHVEGSFNLIPAGCIMMWATSTAPLKWLLCDGTAVSRTTYANLFAAISTTYGTGDGSTTFNLPDFRGRTGIGAGAGTGLTTRTLGATSGTETVTLSVAEMPTHKHTVTDSGHTHGITVKTVGYTSTYNGLSEATGAPNNSTNVANQTYTTASATTGITIADAGSSSAHNNMQPYLVINYIIKT